MQDRYRSNSFLLTQERRHFQTRYDQVSEEKPSESWQEQPEVKAPKTKNLDFKKALFFE